MCVLPSNWVQRLNPFAILEIGQAYDAMQGRYLKDYAAAHEALSKLGSELPVTLYGSSAVAPNSIGSLAASYTTQEVSALALLLCCS